VVTFCIASAAGVLGVVGHHDDAGWDAAGWGALSEVGIGIAVGVGLAWCGGRLMALAHRRDWMQHGSRRLATLGLALMAFVVAEQLGGNPFVSAFVAGLVFGTVARSDAVESIELAELGGAMLSLVVWFIFGAGFVLPVFEEVDASIVAYAICSLTVVRLLPVAIAFLGSSERWPTTAFIGWFGPRGLASVVFALLALEELGETDPRVLTAMRTIAVTVVFSIIAHGVTARPLASRYLATLRTDRRAGKTG
jgi:sodium/hydrogen antiporter